MYMYRRPVGSSGREAIEAMPAVESSRASPRSIYHPPRAVAHFEGRQQVALPLAFRRAPSISPADGDRRAIRRAEEVASGLEEGIARFLWPSTESRFLRVDFTFTWKQRGGTPILLKSFSFSSFCREEDVGWGIRPRPAPNTFIGKSSGIGVDESLAYRSGTCR